MAVSLRERRRAVVVGDKTAGRHAYLDEQCPLKWSGTKVSANTLTCGMGSRWALRVGDWWWEAAAVDSKRG